MNKEAATRLAEVRLAQWSRDADYNDLEWADSNESTTTEHVLDGGVDYKVELTVWREQHAREYTMGVRVSETARRRFFGGAVSRYGRMFPDGRFVEGP
jgi:hypothetical protein